MEILFKDQLKASTHLKSLKPGTWFHFLESDPAEDGAIWMVATNPSEKTGDRVFCVAADGSVCVLRDGDRLVFPLTVQMYVVR